MANPNGITRQATTAGLPISSNPSALRTVCKLCERTVYKNDRVAWLRRPLGIAHAECAEERDGSMICKPCRDGVHTADGDLAPDEIPAAIEAGTICPGPGQCTCQHRTAKPAGTCGAGVQPCGQPARLYACGWRCEAHKP